MGKIKREIKEIIKITRAIDGWLSPQEGFFLFKLANKLPNNAVIVEIGSWKGKSTIWLGSGILRKKDALVYAVDSHIGSPEKIGEYKRINTFNEFKKNMSNTGLNDYVIPIKKSSSIAVKDFKKKIDLLFIDGAHAYTAVKKDFALWSVKLKPGGWIIMHDATVLPGPWKVARDKILLSGQYKKSGMLGSMIFGQLDSFPKLTNLFNNILACIFVMSYVKLRKIPFPKSWRKKARLMNFKHSSKSLTHD